MTSSINWGIVGPGRIAHKFAKDLALVKNAKLHAVASRSLERAKDFAKQYGAAHAYGSYDELTKCPDLDVVYIASPHTGHHPHSLLFLENKIPVLCEKPLAINTRQVREMVKTAREQKTFLMEAIWTRFIPLFEKTIEWVESGIIGPINTIRADFGFKANYGPEHRVFNPKLGGGSLLDVGLYPVFIATHFLGKPVDIRATAIKSPAGTDNSCAMVFRYPDNEIAILDSSLINHTRTTAVLYGEKGRIHLHSRFHEGEQATISIYGKEDEVFNFAKTGIGYFHEIEAVNDCLRRGQTECEKLPLDFSIAMMENLDAVRDAAGIHYPDFD
ncbi:MAG: Gfo/Idh/MocA family oxidoreductase [Bacteroidota bacterium]